MNTESILNKIRGLLAMAEGQANENESLQAMALASQLMTKYGIEQDQLKGPKKVSMAGEGDMIDLFKIHHRILAQAVGELFGCKTLNYNKVKKLSFVGRPENVEACEVTFSWVVMQVEALYKEALPRGMPQTERAQYRKSFKLACAGRVYDRCVKLADQPVEGVTGTALVVHRSQLSNEISDYFETRKVRTVKSRPVKTRHSGARIAGQNAGDRVKLRTEVN